MTHVKIVTARKVAWLRAGRVFKAEKALTRPKETHKMRLEVALPPYIES